MAITSRLALPRALLCGAMPMFASAALAQTAAPASTDQNQDIIVTAQRRREESQNVGMAITAVAGQALREAGVNSARDLVKIAANLQIEDPGNGVNPIINIRGIGERTTDPHVEAPTAVYFDDAYVSFGLASSQPYFDLDRIEVLSGPQGTTFGRNTTAGVINVISKRPSQTFEGYVQSDFGSYGEHGLEGAIGGPLSSTLSARVSAYWRDNDNYVKNLGPGGDTGAHKTLFLRGQLLFEPSDRVSILLNARHWEAGAEPGIAFNYTASVPNPGNPSEPIAPASLAEFQAFCAQPFAPAPLTYGQPTTLQGNCFGASPGPFTGDFGDQTSYRLRFFGTTATITATLNDALILTSISDYIHLTSHFDIDIDGTPLRIINGGSDISGKQFSQELRLSGHHTRFRWLAGFYYLKIDAQSRNSNDLSGHPLFLASYVDAYTTPAQAWAVFGQAEYDLSEKVTVIGGIHYGYDWKSINSHTTCNSVLNGPLPGFPYTSTCDPNYFILFGTPRALPEGFFRQLNKSSWSGKAQLNWKPSADLLIYAGVTRGTRPGGFNSAGAYPAQFITYQPDSVVDYEAGVKSRLFNHSTRLNAAIFHYDYKNFQTLAADSNGFTYVFNINSRVNGVEASLDTQPLRGLSFNLEIAYLDAKEINLPVPGGFADQPMPEAPKWRVTSRAHYEVALAGGTAALQLSWQHTAHKSIQAIDYPLMRIPAQDEVDGEISWTSSNDRMILTIHVDNLTDAILQTDGGDMTLLLGGVARVYNPSRWVRGSVTYRF
jgi:iron complex outermembrane receptor protein